MSLAEPSSNADTSTPPLESVEAQLLKEVLGITSTKEATVLHAVQTLVDEQQALKMKNEYLERDIERMARYLDQMQHDVLNIEQSRAWKLGLKIVRTAKRLLGRNAPDPVFDDIHRLFNTYHHWKKSRD